MSKDLHFRTLAETDAEFKGCSEWLGTEPTRNDSYLAAESVHNMRWLLKRCAESCPSCGHDFVPAY